MPAITVRNLSDELHQALEQRAKSHGRSTEAEIRDILESALDVGSTKIGSALAALGKRLGGVELSIGRDRSPARGADFD